MYDLAFFLHILGVLAFVSGVVVAGVAFESARRRERPGEVAMLLGLSRIGVLLVAFGTMFTGIFGLWLVSLGRWHYDSFWVLCSIVLFLTTLALGGIGGRRPRRARELAVQLASVDAPISDQLRVLLNDRGALAQNYAALLLVLTIIAVMCFKP